MWLFVLFDLPVDSKKSRKEYANFRKKLLAKGFDMLQFSVYARFYKSEEAAEAHRRFVKSVLPPRGQVRLVGLTDRQFGKMEVYNGENPAEAEKPPDQLMLF
jgi:CRISPR-associated protein Cas2